MSEILIDGLPATTDDLVHQATVNYGAYTSFRVEKGAARGLDLHIARLEQSAIELFGESPGEAEFRRLMTLAVRGRDACWLRVSLFSPEIGHRNPSFVGRPKVMTAVSPAPSPLAVSMRVATVLRIRDAAHLKHVATFGQTLARRAARVSGFDDALFIDERGRVSEGVSWNIGFMKGAHVIWPEAPMLEGVTQVLIQKGLMEVGLSSEVRSVPLDEIAAFDGAFLCNSATPVCPITAIDGHVFATDATRLAQLEQAWLAAPLQTI